MLLIKIIVTITFLSSSNKIDILSNNITELRKGKFEEVTIGRLNAN